jgi:hypothetical protein
MCTCNKYPRNWTVLSPALYLELWQVYRIFDGPLVDLFYFCLYNKLTELFWGNHVFWFDPLVKLFRS